MEELNLEKSFFGPDRKKSSKKKKDKSLFDNRKKNFRSLLYNEKGIKLTFGLFMGGSAGI